MWVIEKWSRARKMRTRPEIRMKYQDHVSKFMRGRRSSFGRLADGSGFFGEVILTRIALGPRATPCTALCRWFARKLRSQDPRRSLEEGPDDDEPTDRGGD